MPPPRDSTPNPPHSPPVARGLRRAGGWAGGGPLCAGGWGEGSWDALRPRAALECRWRDCGGGGVISEPREGKGREEPPPARRPALSAALLFPRLQCVQSGRPAQARMVRLLWGFWWCLPGLLHGGAAAAAFLPFSAEGIFRAFGSLVEPSQVSGGGGGGRRRGQRDEPAQGIALSDKGGAGGRAGWRMSWPLFRDFSAAPPSPTCSHCTAHPSVLRHTCL